MTRAAARAARKPAPAPALGPVVELWFEDILGVDPCNERHFEPSFDAIAQLAASIVSQGLLNPLIVRGEPGRWRVVAGSRRWRALKLITRLLSARLAMMLRPG